ncbi:MAG TPA: hypothetical protein VG672_26650 [Bryobacteraceae bacterium]|jgi:hypothetical protein|nr:hypothetical protein [Bryobacteraceae bacterium]
MRFTPEDARSRYRATLGRMQPSKMAVLGDNWSAARLAFFFSSDQNLAAFSARDTLLPMLEEDHRELSTAILGQFLNSITLDQEAGSVAVQVFDTYAISRPRG